MSYFSNIKHNNDSLSFEINNNNIKIGFVNSLRRIMISEIPIYAIDRFSVIFNVNSSLEKKKKFLPPMIHNNILLDRLELLPISYDFIKNYNLDNLEFKLNKINNTDHIIDVLVDDFNILYENSIIPTAEIFISTDVLFSKLKPNCQLDISGKFKISTAKINGPGFSSVTVPSVTFKEDNDKLIELTKNMDEIDANNFINNHGQRYYKKNKLGEPAIYLFNIESIGVMDPRNIFSISFNILRDKLNYLLHSLDNNITEKISINISDKLFESFDFLIIDENDTVGNLLNYYLKPTPNVKYSGYIIPHPNDNKLIITTALHNNNTIDENIAIFTNNIKNILKIIDNLSSEWKSFSTKKTTNVVKKIKIKKV